MDMSQHIEIEFKNLLLKEEFARLCAYFHVLNSDFIRQENHYFDTQDFSLKNLGCALRIREKNGHFEMTFKQPHPDGLLETNENVSEKQALSFINGEDLQSGAIYSTLTGIGIHPKELTYFGTLATERAEFPYNGGLLVLDCSSYLNIQDYEVEYEVTNKVDGELIFHQLLNELQIPVRKTKNKVRRFYERKKALETNKGSFNE